MLKKFKIPWSTRSHFFLTKEKNEIIKILNKSKSLSQGEWLGKFENKFLNFLNSKGKAYAVTSGASAIELAASVLKLKSTDEIIIPSHTYCASALPFVRYNTKIKWVDINKDDFTINVEHLKKIITKKTKVIVAVHLYGLPCEIAKIKKICNEKKIILIEDCAQSLGSKIKDRYVGTYGDMAIFSFHQQKNMTTLGEGGMLVVNNKKFQKYIPGLKHNGHRDYPNKKKYWQPAMVDVYEDLKGVTPFNFPMTEIQACAGYYLLDRVKKLNNIRNIRAKKIIKSFKEFKFIKFQRVKPKNYSSYHLLPAYFDKDMTNFSRDKFINIISKKYGIQLIIQYHPLDKYHFFKKKYKPKKNDLINTYNFYNNMFSIPFHVWMSDKQLNYLISSCRNELKKIKYFDK
tara:strand:+ start:10932 stop:12134 length:1203 start_codon:yes stop_codon:yes gene_type:complete